MPDWRYTCSFGTDLPILPVVLQLGFFTTQIEKVGIHVRPSMPSSHLSRTRSRQELDDLEARISEHENRLLQMNNSHETMQRRYLELTELKHVLRETSDFFQEVIDPALKLNRDKIKNCITPIR